VPARHAKTSRGGSPAGTSFATGRPFFVIITGSRFERTSSMTFRQRALNSAAAMVFIRELFSSSSWSVQDDYGHIIGPPTPLLRERPPPTVEHRLDHSLPALPGGRRKGNPCAEPGSVELAEPSRSIAATELVDFRRHGGDANRSRARELDEHSLFV